MREKEGEREEKMREKMRGNEKERERKRRGKLLKVKNVDSRKKELFGNEKW